jgi:hypothetical protein
MAILDNSRWTARRKELEDLACELGAKLSMLRTLRTMVRHENLDLLAHMQADFNIAAKLFQQCLTATMLDYATDVTTHVQNEVFGAMR